MQPSSLIFLVIIAIWAAYFLQYWVRRREHLATARSVDRFSESMRVLERRLPLVETDLSVPQARSYAVSPARAARPQVVVKRAEPAEAVTGAEVDDSPAPGPGSRALGTASAVPGLAFLGSVAALVLVLGLAAFTVVPWLLVIAPVVAVAGSFLWVRAGVVARRAARRPARQALRRTGAGRRAAPSTPAPVPAAATERPASSGGEGASSDVQESLYDIQAVEAAASPAAVAPAHAVPAAAAAPMRPVPLVDEDDIPLTWDPVPVPPPTYTMKAKAQRPVPPGPMPPEASATGAAEAEQPAYEEPVRRVVGG